MGMVIVISLPLILFSVVLGFGCYFVGRAKGRQDVRTNAQIFGIPTPPPGSDATVMMPPCSSPPPTHLKTFDKSDMVWFCVISFQQLSLWPVLFEIMGFLFIVHICCYLCNYWLQYILFLLCVVEMIQELVKESFD